MKLPRLAVFTLLFSIAISTFSFAQEKLLEGLYPNWTCMLSFSEEAPGLIINDVKTFKKLIRQQSPPNNSSCADIDFTQIDFEKYTLLGKFTGMGGCKLPYYDHQIVIDEKNKKCIYKIKITTYGLCEPYYMNMHWVLIPKLPKDCIVEFEVEEQKSSE